jgi:hypothetical protein
VAADKTLALFGRAAARDLVDVAALSERYTLQQLCERAAEKDPGFDHRVLADALAAAAAHSTLPSPSSAWRRTASPPSGPGDTVARPPAQCRGHIRRASAATTWRTDAATRGSWLSWPFATIPTSMATALKRWSEGSVAIPLNVQRRLAASRGSPLSRRHVRTSARGPAVVLSAATATQPGEHQMSRREVLELIDDLDDQVLRDGDGETVTFGLDGTEYEIDLSTKNAARLRSALEPFISAGRHSIGKGRPSTRPAVTRVDTAADPAAVRAWAAAHGIPVSNRGRVPADVVAKFRASGN